MNTRIRHVESLVCKRTPKPTAFSAVRPQVQKRLGRTLVRFGVDGELQTVVEKAVDVAEATEAAGVDTVEANAVPDAAEEADAAEMAEAVKTAEAATQELEDRVVPIYSEDDLVQALEEAGDALVVLEVMADEVCESGLAEPNDGWTPDQDEIKRMKIAKCTQIKHAYMRMAAELPDVRFLAMLGTDLDAERAEFSERLGVTTYPTVIFFKNNQILWTSSGSLSLEHDMKEGVFYFGDTYGASGLKGSKHVQDLKCKDDLDTFIAGDGGPELQFLMVTAPFCSPCVRVYPSIVMLAMNFKGVLSFARLGDDETPEMQALFKSLKILEVPTFITFKDGVEVSRCVSGNKGALIGHILEVVARHGISLPARTV